MSNLKILVSTLFLVPLVTAIPYVPPENEIFGGSNLITEIKNVSYRLPENNPVPSHYLLDLETYLTPDKNFTFDGIAYITIEFKKADMKFIYLHAKQLEIKDISLTISNTTKLVAKNFSINTVTDILTIELPSAPPIGNNYTLYIKYTGLLNDQLRGFYRSSYTNYFGEKEWMASTHFEPVGARQAFPCWDEPGFKATFKIDIIHDEKYTALSNMNLESKFSLAGNRFRSYFETTPKMSTYLVAFIVANFDSRSSTNDTSFKVWARKDKIIHGKFAAEIGLEQLRALEQFTNITHKDAGFSKMDSIALPELAPGAMENWGIVTYRESGLLVEENVTSTSTKEAIAKVIAHEFAHQWFGDLVSPKWWNYIWLNEGFANFFQSFNTDQIRPKWRLMERYLVEIVQGSAFAADGVNTSHSMDVKVESQNEISSIFDSITYSKAGSVIRMFRYILGNDDFQKALRSYLQKKKFDVSTSDDLIDELAKVNPQDKDRKTAFTSWVRTAGYPILTVTRNYTTGVATLQQSRFLYSKNQISANKYWIPINYVTGDSKDFNNFTISWMKPDVESMSINSITNSTWVIFNTQQFGYYRVNYDEHNWKLIENALKANHSNIHVLNRAQLIDDSLNLARIGKLFYNVTLPLLQYLKQETDYVPWHTAWSGISYLHKMLANTEQSQAFKNYVLDLTGSLVQHVKFNESSDDDHVKKLQRVTVIEKTCTFGLKECRDHTYEKLKKWLDDSTTNALSSDLKNVILCAGIRSADKTVWNKLLEKFKVEQNNDILTALGCTSNTEILNDYLLMAVNRTLITEKQRDTIFKGVYSGSDEGVNVALDFIKIRAAIITNNGTDTTSVKKYISDIGQRVTNNNQLTKIKELSVTIAGINDTIAKVVVDAQENIEWVNVQAVEIQEFFKQGEKGSPDAASITTLSTILLSLSLAALAFN